MSFEGGCTGLTGCLFCLEQRASCVSNGSFLYPHNHLFDFLSLCMCSWKVVGLDIQCVLCVWHSSFVMLLLLLCSVAYPKRHTQNDISDIYLLPAETRGVFVNIALQVCCWQGATASEHDVLQLLAVHTGSASGKE